MRSPGPGQNPLHDLWGPARGNYRGFTWKVPGGKLPSNQTWYTAWRELWSRTHAPAPSPPTVLLCVYVFLARIQPFGSLLLRGYWPGPSQVSVLRHPDQRSLKKLFSSLTQYFPLLALPLSRPAPHPPSP